MSRDFNWTWTDGYKSPGSLLIEVLKFPSAGNSTRTRSGFGMRLLESRLVGTNEDLSFYEGAREGPDVAKVKEALKKEAMTK